MLPAQAARHCSALHSSGCCTVEWCPTHAHAADPLRVARERRKAMRGDEHGGDEGKRRLMWRSGRMSCVPNKQSCTFNFGDC